MHKNSKMWIILMLLAALFVEGRGLADSREGMTTLILVRHAEKVQDGSADPPLTAEGRQRAGELLYILGHVKLDAIFSTPYRRTRETVAPVADARGMDIKSYSPGKIRDFVATVLSDYRGMTLLVAGHSNTIPRMANELAGSQLFDDLEDPVYDNLFIVTVGEKNSASILRLRFGARTPEK